MQLCKKLFSYENVIFLLIMVTICMWITNRHICLYSNIDCTRCEIGRSGTFSLWKQQYMGCDYGKNISITQLLTHTRLARRNAWPNVAFNVMNYSSDYVFVFFSPPTITTTKTAIYTGLTLDFNLIACVECNGKMMLSIGLKSLYE